MTELLTCRRSFLTGLGAALITVPAIVRAGSLMPVKALDPALMLQGVDPVVFRECLFWVTQSEPQVIHWSKLQNMLEFGAGMP